MTGPATVLLVDDERANLDSLARILAKEGLRTVAAESAEAALEALRTQPIAVVLTDLMMPGMNGMDLLRAARAVAPEVQVILMTAYGTVETAVEAMKEGAYDFVTKPLKRHAVVKAVRQALEKQALLAENRALRARLSGFTTHALVGQSPIFRATMDLVRQAAPSNATVLLTGESGTGKELVARAIHQMSSRAQGPFVPINCAAIPETILESELFGYERGAFTGATARKEGRIERAHQGTLFLDEVAEMTLPTQAKLLRVLQEGEIERLGGTAPIKVDVRVVAATNKDLEKRVEEGTFREDLFYRLNVIRVPLPPLRDRLDDVPLLAQHFFRAAVEKNGRALRGFSRAAMDALSAYNWPGNVRELKNAVERAVVLCKGDVVEVEDLPESVRAAVGEATAPPARQVVIEIGTPLEEVERRLIRETLRHTRGDKNLAAQLLGIGSRTIYRKLDK